MGYKVKLNVFEGPFDLLVYLIEHAQMSIYDIKIAGGGRVLPQPAAKFPAQKKRLYANSAYK